MDIHENIPLKNFTTMKLGGPAKYFVEARTKEDLVSAYTKAKTESLPVFVIGDGSNIIARDEGFNGMIIHMRIPGFEIISDDINSTSIKIGAGENWDSVVKRAVDMDLSGIEAMSGIPGTAGGTPIQNVGAYGQEIADTLQSLEAFDTQSETFVTLSNEACSFSYRNSIFRSNQKGRYIVTSIILKLSKSLPQPPFYDALQKYLEERNITIFNHGIIRDAVLAIRHNKLPDPKISPNTGSFFKNIIVEDWQLNELKKSHPEIPSFDMAGGKYKIPTGWLIEQAGLKGKTLHGMKLHDNNALVLINVSATTYHDLEMAREEIVNAVRDKFRLQIEQEPLEI